MPFVLGTFAAVFALTPAAQASAQEEGSPALIGKLPGDAKWNVARDFAAVMPVGPSAADSGLMVGPLVRVGFQATKNFELGIRSGYLYGLDKDIGGGQVTALSSVPIVATVRWFFLREGVGPYAGVEAGASLLRRRNRSAAESGVFDLDFHAANNHWGATTTVAAGVVLSKRYPIDLRAQVSALDLLASGGPLRAVAVGATAGWTIYF